MNALAKIQFLTVLALAAGVAHADPATAPVINTPRGVVDVLTHDAVAVMADTTLKPEEKHQKVLQLAYDHLDFETLSKLSLGTYWRDLNAAKRAEFVPEFKKHLSNTYVHMIDEYTDEQVKITGERSESNGDDTLLTSVLGTRDGQRQEVAKVEYRLRKTNDQWKIIDVTIDNVSLASNFRSQFQEIMANGGIEKLLKLLRDKNAGK